MNESFREFMDWEAASRSLIDFKTAYVDVAGDILAGLLLSELIYWFLPTREGHSKLRVEQAGEWWVAVRYADWWQRARLTERQAERAVGILVRRGIVIKGVFKFNGVPTIHLRLNPEVLLDRLKAVVSHPPTGPGDYDPIPVVADMDVRLPPMSATTDMETRYNGHPLTETTTETTKSGEDATRVPEPQTPEQTYEDFEGGSPEPETPGGEGGESAALWQNRLYERPEVKNPGALAAMQEWARTQARKGVESLPEEVAALGAAFAKATGLAPGRSDRAFWIKSLRILREDGITPEEVREAVAAMRQEKLTIKSPASIRAIALDLRARRKSLGNKNRLLFED